MEFSHVLENLVMMTEFYRSENNIIKRDKWTIVRDTNCKIRKTIFFPLQGVLPAMFDNKMTVYNVKRMKTLIMPGKDSKINHDTVLKI